MEDASQILTQINDCTQSLYLEEISPHNKIGDLKEKQRNSQKNQNGVFKLGIKDLTLLKQASSHALPTVRLAIQL